MPWPFLACSGSRQIETRELYTEYSYESFLGIPIFVVAPELGCWWLVRRWSMHAPSRKWLAWARARSSSSRRDIDLVLRQNLGPGL